MTGSQARGSAKLWRLLGVFCVVAAGVGLVSATASAVAPGRNGRIAFRRYLDAQQDWGAVFTIGADGENATQITRPARGVIDDQPEWAPDGSLIAFTRCPHDGVCHVFVVTPGGTDLAPVGARCAVGANDLSCSHDSYPSFAPDSKRLALVQATGTLRQDSGGALWIEHSALALVNRDGTGRHVIYQGTAFSGDLAYPVFSPDGKQLVFERTVSGFSRPAGQRAVFVVGVDGSGLRRITPWEDDDGDNPDWSPDGRWILFQSFVDEPQHQAQIFLVHPDGSGRKQLTHFGDGTHVASSAFAPDGMSIVFSKGPDGGNIDLYVMALAGTHVQRVTRSKLWESAPDWGPR